MDFEVNTLIDTLKQGLGLEAAKKIVLEALNQAGINQNTKKLTLDQYIKVCEILKEKKGYVSIVAKMILTKLNLQSR